MFTLSYHRVIWVIKSNAHNNLNASYTCITYIFIIHFFKNNWHAFISDVYIAMNGIASTIGQLLITLAIQLANQGQF